MTAVASDAKKLDDVTAPDQKGTSKKEPSDNGMHNLKSDRNSEICLPYRVVANTAQRRIQTFIPSSENVTKDIEHMLGWIHLVLRRV